LAWFRQFIVLNWFSDVEKVKEMKEKDIRVLVNVFLTKRFDFRAIIKEPGQYVYEVTVGSKSWGEGKGRKYKDEIFSRMGHIVLRINARFHLLTGWVMPEGITLEDVRKLSEMNERKESKKIIDKEKTWCDSCGNLIPSMDIYYVRKAGKQKIECVCKNCISFVKKLGKIKIPLKPKSSLIDFQTEEKEIK